MKRKLLSIFFTTLLIGTVFTMISLGKLESGGESIGSRFILTTNQSIMLSTVEYGLGGELT